MTLLGEVDINDNFLALGGVVHADWDEKMIGFEIYFLMFVLSMAWGWGD